MIDLAQYAGFRIKQLRSEKKMTQTELAKRLKIGKSAISNYEAGYRMPKQDLLFALSNVFGVDVDFFFPSEEKHTSTTLSLINDTSAKLHENRQKVVLTTAEQQLSEQEQIKQQNASKTKAPILSLNEARARKTLHEVKKSPQKKIPIDLYGILTAGYGSENFDKESTETVYVSSVPPHYDLAFRVAGDSMYPAFEDGEIVFVKETDCIHNGMVAAVEIDEAAFLKKIYLEEDSIRLVSLNDDIDENGDRLYPDIFANEDNEIYIIGKVVN